MSDAPDDMPDHEEDPDAVPVTYGTEEEQDGDSET